MNNDSHRADHNAKKKVRKPSSHVIFLNVQLINAFNWEKFISFVEKLFAVQY